MSSCPPDQGECRAGGIAWHLGLRFSQSGFIFLLQSNCPPDSVSPLQSLLWVFHVSVAAKLTLIL